MIVYSICMCVKNMDKTVEIALLSILTVIDETYEIVVVDDASTDRTPLIIKRLALQYPQIVFIPLMADSDRKLGRVRNIAVENARGKYILNQFDADNYMHPSFIKIVDVFHRLEKIRKKDFYLYSDVHVCKRDFFMKAGGYRNEFFEDSELSARLISQDEFVYLNLEFPLRYTMPRSARQVVHRLLYRKTFLVFLSRFNMGIPFINHLIFLVKRRGGLLAEAFYIFVLYRVLISCVAKFQSIRMRDCSSEEMMLPAEFRDMWAFEKWSMEHGLSVTNSFEIEGN